MGAGSAIILAGGLVGAGYLIYLAAKDFSVLSTTQKTSEQKRHVAAVVDEREPPGA